MKTALLTIATNNYKVLLSDLIKSIDDNILSKSDIFIFSDENLFYSEKHTIIFNKIEHEPWPFITLRRFEFFSSILERLEEYDSIIYIDCDMIISKQIESFPNTDFFAVSHPANSQNSNFWPTEKNPKSTAYLPLKKNIPYVQGCLWGGSRDSIIKLITELNQNIMADLNNDIIASWHDESHLNKFLSNVEEDKITILHSGYAYPECWTLNNEKIIIHKDKNMIQYPRFEGK